MKPQTLRRVSIPEIALPLSIYWLANCDNIFIHIHLLYFSNNETPEIHIPRFCSWTWSSHKHWVVDVCLMQSFLKLCYSWIKLNHFFQGSCRHSILLRTVFSGNHGEKGFRICLNTTQCSVSLKCFRLRADTHVPFLRFQKDLKVMIVRLSLTDFYFLIQSFS